MAQEHGYRRARGSQVWHFCRNCSSWPATDYEGVFTRPEGQMCRECLDMARAGDCR